MCVIVPLYREGAATTGEYTVWRPYGFRNPLTNKDIYPTTGGLFLVEWPRVIFGVFDDAVAEVPPECAEVPPIFYICLPLLTAMNGNRYVSNLAMEQTQAFYVMEKTIAIQCTIRRYQVQCTYKQMVENNMFHVVTAHFPSAEAVDLACTSPGTRTRSKTRAQAQTCPCSPIKID